MRSVVRALVFSLLFALMLCKVSDQVAGDLGRHDAHVTSLW